MVATSAPLTTRPWEAPVPEPPANAFSSPDGAAGGGGGELVVADLDGPGALADRNAGQRRLILGFQPALRGAPASGEQQHSAGAQADNYPAAPRGRNWR